MASTVSRFTKFKENPSKYGGIPFVKGIHPPFGSVSKAISLFLTPNDYANRTQNIIRQWLSSSSLITSYENLLRFLHSITPNQQRVARQRQKLVGQSSDRIGRSMKKIIEEIGRLETEMKKLGELSSTLSTERTFTVDQDGQFVSRPT